MEADVLSKLEFWAERTPDAPAVRAGTRSLTYRELFDASLRVADRIAAGARLGEVVALYGGLSPEYVACLLGVWRAGRIAMPLSAADPAAHLARLLEEVQPALALCLGDPASVLADSGIPCMGLDGLKLFGAASMSPTKKSPADAAYVVFTSGSTGKPKAVLGSRSAVSQFAAWQCRALQLDGSDRMLAQAHIGFDASLKEICCALTAGAALYLPPTATPLADPAKFVAWIDASKLTVAQMVPSVAQLLCDSAPREVELASLRVLCLGGEPLTAKRVETWRTRFPRAGKIVNLYGLTETTILKAYYVVPASLPKGVLPLGVGIDGATLRVVGADGRECGAGEEGEIVIRTAYGALACLNAPGGATPLGRAVDGERSVRDFPTGDLGRRDGAGLVEFVGRKDDTVKVGGVRVSPLETASLLGRHPDVADCCVLSAQTPEGGQLRAAFTRKEGSRLEVRELAAWLRERAPLASLPSRWLVLPALPRTANGKVDRKQVARLLEEKVAAPDAPLPADDSAPLSRMRGIWARLPGLAPEGENPDFFEAGGHSLLLIRLAAILKKEFGVPVTLPQLLGATTLEAMSALVAVARPGEVRESTASATEVRPTAAQRQLWFLHQHEPSRRDFSITFELHVRAPLTRVEQALNAVLARHEAFRMVLGECDGEPVLRFLPAAPVCRSGDVRGLSEPEQAEAIAARRRELAEEPFDLSSGPLVRVWLAAVADSEVHVVVSTNHVVMDGVSWNIVLEEVASLLEGSAPEQLPAAQSLSAYALRHERWRLSPEAEQELRYWKEKLAGLPPPAALPLAGVESTRVGVGTYRCGLPPELVAAVRARQQELCVSPHEYLLAVFEVLLARLTGQADVVVATDVAARMDAESERTVGMLMNLQLLRTEVHSTMTFEEVVAAARDTVRGALRNQLTGFDAVASALGLGGRPAFRYMFRSTPSADMGAGALRILGNVHKLVAHAKFDLTFALSCEQERWSVEVEYEQGVFADDYVACLVAQYIRLAAELTRLPKAAVGRHALGKFDAARMLSAAPSWQAQRSVLEAIVRHAVSVGNGAAIIDGAAVTTYRELLDACLRVARWADDGGIPRGARVAIVGSRCTETIVAMVGVLLAGRVIAPIDEQIPEARRRTMCRDAAVRGILSLHRVESDAGSDCVAGIIREVLRAHEPSALPAIAPLALADEAYVFFTSGSTGTPKGVRGTHEGLAHFVSWESEAFAVTPQDRVAQFVGLSFDAVLRDVFVPLANGAACVIPPARLAERVEDVLAWVAEQEITLIHTVPSVVRLWLASAPQAVQLPRLRVLALSGEALDGELVQRWRDLTGDAADVYNLYGPTETTMVKTAHRAPGGPVRGKLLVGRPMPGCQLLVLRADGGTSGVGELGEVFLRTAYGTLGYLDGGAAGGAGFRFLRRGGLATDLVYATGDLGCVDAGGRLHIAGRRDHQVKIRGVRVNPQEVELVLRSLAGVSDAVVVSIESSDGGAALVAFVVAARADLAAAEVREALVHALPSAFVPELVRMVDAIPHTTSGKADRAALRELARTGNEPERDAPGTDDEATWDGLEREVADIWASVLGRRPRERTADFFDEGGHSLAATLLLSRVRRRFDVQVSLRTFLSTRNLAGIVAAVRGGAAHAAAAPNGAGLTVLSSDSGAAGAAICLPPMGGSVAVYRDLARLIGAGRPVLACASLGLAPDEHVLQGIPEQAALCARLLKQGGVQPGLLIGWSYGGAVALELAHQLRALVQAEPTLIVIDSAPLMGRNRGALPADSSLLRWFVQDLIGMRGTSLTELPAEVDIDQAFECAVATGLIATDFDREDWRRAFHVFRANVASLGTFEPRPYSGKALLISAGDEIAVQRHRAVWSHLLPAARQFTFPCGHFELLRQPIVNDIAGLIVEAEREATVESGR